MLDRELALSHVARIGLAEDGMAVTGDDLAGLERRPDVVTDGLVRSVLADLRLHLAEPEENFLVCETVERASKTVQGGGKGEEGVRESGADELAGMGRDVTALMIGVDSQVKTHELDKVRLVGITEEVGKVVGVILLEVDCRELVTAVHVAEYATGDVGQLGNANNLMLERRAWVRHV